MKANQATNEMTTFTQVTSETLDKALDGLNLEGLNVDTIETERNLLSQFRANLDRIEELNARLHFVLNEIRPYIR